MTPSLNKRFWKTVSVTQTDDGFGVALDTHALKTPLKAPLTVPTKAMAQMVRDEWDAPVETVDLMTMPVTRLVNATIDKVAVNKQSIIDNLAEYAGTDLLCYRATTDTVLIERQAAVWDPILDWAATTYNAPLNVTQGVMHVDQPTASLAALKSQLETLSNFELSAAHELISISGSFLIALSVITNHLSIDAAWDACRIDETYQIDQWGADEEAQEMALVKQQAFRQAKSFFDAALV